MMNDEMTHFASPTTEELPGYDAWLDMVNDAMDAAERKEGLWSVNIADDSDAL